jgi:hypothetical protein
LPLISGTLFSTVQSAGGNALYIDSITGTSSTKVVGRIPATPSNVQALQTSVNSILQSSSTYIT